MHQGTALKPILWRYMVKYARATRQAVGNFNYQALYECYLLPSAMQRGKSSGGRNSEAYEEKQWPFPNPENEEINHILSDNTDQSSHVGPQRVLNPY